VECISTTYAIIRFKEVTTILNEHGADLATFVCSCSKNDKLTAFKGQVTDSSGRVIRKIKESELKQTEYSPYLAIDDYKVYYDYTPPVYPVTITYEWTIDSRDNVIEFPSFCPLSEYDVNVKKATYSLKVPKSMAIRHALQNINNKVNVSDGDKNTQIFTLQVDSLPALKQEAYSRPLREKLPLAWFAPTDFVYYGTKGSLKSWADYGKWEYSLIQDRDQLSDAERQELHQLTDGLKTDREKVEAIYKRLEKSTRYVAVLLGIGGQQPAPAASVSKSGFGDCKGLSNYMRAMLKEIGIPSNYTTISTINRRLQKDFASVGQMNHVILQVPLKNDTLWLECTNPQLPMGYVHEDIAGHDAIEVSQTGGRLVRLPVYADSTNLMHSAININLSEQGAANLKVSLSVLNRQYESCIPLLKADEKDRQKYLHQIVHAPQAEIGKVDINESGAKITLDAEIKSQKYANQTGQRLFVPICPVHRGYTVPNTNTERIDDIWRDMGYLDTDDITITIPEGYAIEACPKGVSIEQPFASFSFSIKADGNTIHVKNRLLMKSGTFPKSQYPQLADFIRSINSAYNQKVVLKKKAE
jgi:transglutaminase-like putative cysteine protease